MRAGYGFGARRAIGSVLVFPRANTMPKGGASPSSPAPFGGNRTFGGSVPILAAAPSFGRSVVRSFGRSVVRSFGTGCRSAFSR